MTTRPRMRCVIKATIPRECLREQPVNVPLPRGSRVLTVGAEGLIPCLYVEATHETVAELEPRWFLAVMTGPRAEIPDGAPYLGTVRMPPADGGAALVLHLFEVGAP